MNKNGGLAGWLVQHAARSAPPELAERLEEEWLADLATRPGTLARLRLAVGCCWATRVIAHEHCVVRVPAAVTATGSKIMTAYARSDVSYFSGRTVSFFLIVCLHVAIIYVFAAGLARPLLTKLIPPMDVVTMPDAPPRKPPPDLQPPQLSNRFVIDTSFQPPPVVVDPPPVVTDVPSAMAITPPSLHVPAASTKVVNRVGGGPGKGFPNTDDYYPANALRLGQEGTATVRTCVDEKGRLTAMPTLSQSSGTTSLDEGALKLAKAGSGHYRPTTEDGQPMSSCYEFRIGFHVLKKN
jgi:TonB family protein